MNIADRQMRNLDKLNDLIPELQALISTGKLGTTHGISHGANPGDLPVEGMAPPQTRPKARTSRNVKFGQNDRNS